MKVDFSTVLTDIGGNEIMFDKDKVFTLKLAACNALSAQFDDETISGEEKARRGALAIKIYNTPDIDLPIEDIALIKRLIGKLYSPIIVARSWAILEGK